jgi:hypothetical protein
MVFYSVAESKERGVLLGALEYYIKLGVDLNLQTTDQKQAGWTMDTCESADYKTTAATAVWFACLFACWFGRWWSVCQFA